MGPVAAKVVLRAVHREPAAAVLARLDEAHAELARERRDLRLAREAVLAIAAEPLDAPRPSDAMAISELATALGTTRRDPAALGSRGAARAGQVGTGAGPHLLARAGP
jgi:hypothetical protein